MSFCWKKIYPRNKSKKNWFLSLKKQIFELYIDSDLWADRTLLKKYPVKKSLARCLWEGLNRRLMTSTLNSC